MKKLFVLVFAIALCLGVLCVGASAADIQPNEPEQDSSGVYQIGTAAELYWFAQTVNEGDYDAHAVLTDNITINSDVLDENGNLITDKTFTRWTPICGEMIQKYVYTEYTGTFDGQGYTISGLYYSDSSNYVGLFGYVGSGGQVKNVNVADSYISNSYSSSSSSSGITGGVCGDNGGTITNCSFDGSVTGNGNKVNDVGGVCGWNHGTITNCSNTGSVTGNGTGVNVVGGVCGYNSSFGTIANCYNTGSVSGTYTGGVCGENNGTITNCYWREVSGLNGWGINNGTVTNVEPKTNDQFASGEVAWLLNGGTQMNGPWRQDLSVASADDFPVLDNNKHLVHYNGTGYENGIHAYNDGFCSCGAYKPATLVDGVYQISNAGQLYWFAGLVNGDTSIIGSEVQQNKSANAVLTADITINENVLNENGSLNGDGGSFTQWTPIGGEEILPYDYTEYTGTFDGGGYTISGLYYSCSGDYAGLFGYVGSGGQVKNVNVVDSYISNSIHGGYTGGVCGYNSGTIMNCYNTGSVTGTGTVNYVGGVCGYNSGTIMNCYNTGSVTGTNDRAYAGGVCGNNYSGTITNCYNTGNVSGEGNFGGVCGYNYNGTITNCYWLNSVLVGIGGSNDESPATNVKSKTNDQFASGEVAWLLNKGQTNGPWRQNLSGDADTSPVLDIMHKEVVKLTVDDTVRYLNKGDSFTGENGKVYYDSNNERVENTFTVYEDTSLTSKLLVTVTADDKTAFVGDAMPALTYTFAGFEEGETFTESPVVSCTPDMNEAGAYTITVSGGKAYEKYAIDYVDGTLTVKPSWTVTVKYENGDADESSYVHPGGTFKLPDAPSRSGYTFVGWSDGRETYEPGNSVPITADMTFTAVWQAINIPDPNGITVTQPENGTVKVNPSNGSEGTLITVTATPDEGYELAYITVDGEKITGNTFRMPDKSVTVSAVFVPATFPFVDVKTGDWFYDAVAYVYANGLMDGTSATTFEPNANMTRAMVWAILARIDGETVTGEDWIETAREWAMANGVSDGENASGYVTREQLATMLWRYAGEPASSYSLSAYTDAASVSDWAQTAMAWAVEHGIITGMTDTTIEPQGTAIRAQCAAMLMRFMEL